MIPAIALVALAVVAVGAHADMVVDFDATNTTMQVDYTSSHDWATNSTSGNGTIYSTYNENGSLAQSIAAYSAAGLRIRNTTDGGKGTALFGFDLGGAYQFGSGPDDDISIKTGGTTSRIVDAGTGTRAAVRNDGTWYVSEEIHMVGTSTADALALDWFALAGDTSAGITNINGTAVDASIFADMTMAGTWTEILGKDDTGGNPNSNYGVQELQISFAIPYDEVSLSSTNLYVQGAKFMNIDGNGMNLHRFDSNLLSGATAVNVNETRAKTTSGVKLTFYTRSETARLHFDYISGDENRNSRFGLYQDGAQTATPYFAKTETNIVITLTSGSPGELVRHDVVLPHWSNPILSKMELEPGEVLEAGNPYPVKKMVFLGDSISHGTGQGASYETYPYIATDMMDMELFNMAVGGGKIAPEVADLLQHFDPVDAIWVLVGFNDWQGGSETTNSIASDYESLLASIRTHQPSAEVFCSTLTFTHDTTNDIGVTDSEVRQAVSDVVNTRISAGDTRLHLVQGDDYSDDTFLQTQPHNDTVHFTVQGAAMFATNVVDIVDPVLTPAIEAWVFNTEADGTLFTGLSNSGDSAAAAWSSDVSHATVTNNALRFSQGANVYRNSTTPGGAAANATNGVFELSWAYTDANVDSADVAGANAGFGIRSGGTDLFMVRLQRQNSELRLQTRVNTTNTDLHDFNATAAANVDVRVVFDLDSDTFDVYMNNDGAGETLVGDDIDMAITGGQLDNIRMIASVASPNFDADDYIEVDDLRLNALTSAREALVNYQMNDGAGTLQNALAQTGTDSGSLPGTDSFIATDGSGNLAWTAVTADATRKHAMDATYSTGTYVLEYRLSDWNMDASAALNGVKVGVWSGSTGLQLIAELDGSSNFQLRTAATGGTTTSHDFANVATEGLTLRLAIDFTGSGTYDVLYKTDSGSWTTKASGLSLGDMDTSGFNEFRLATEGTTAWDSADYLEMDYAVLWSSAASGNNAPAFNSDLVEKADATADAEFSDTLAYDAIDADGDTLTFSKVSGPVWLTVAGGGALSGTPAVGDTGANVWTVMVSDGRGSDTAQLNIEVIGNQAPVFDSDPLVADTVTINSNYVDTGYTLADHASDSDGHPMTFSKLSGPVWLTVAGGGALSGTAPASTGRNQWEVQVVDGQGGTNTTTLEIHVNSGLTPQTGTNILFIAIDDMKPTIGAYGDPIAKTPKMDALADSGTAFLNAHCQFAVCGPSRASLMTGLMPEETGVTGFRKMRGRTVDPENYLDNEVALIDLVTLPEHFKHHGYKTAAVGKLNDNRCVGSINEDDTINDDGSSVDDPRSWTMSFISPSGQSSTTATLEGDTKSMKLAAESVDAADEAFTDGMICTNGLARLQTMAAGDKPFFLGVGFKRPHLPFLAPKTYWDKYSRDDFTPHPFQQDMTNVTAYTFNNITEMRNGYYLETNGVGEAIAFSDGVLPDAQQKELLHGYYACSSFVDDLVGRLLDELDTLGLASNTIVVLWGDHGFHLGDHNEWGKHTALEQATRSPLIIRAPGYAGGETTQSPANFLDLYPTLCDLAGLPVPTQPVDTDTPTGRPLSGKSLEPILADASASVHTGALGFYPNSGAYGYAYRTERYRYVEWINSSGTIVAQELYDYATDPMETINLAGILAYKALIRELSEAMRNDGYVGAERLMASAAAPKPHGILLMFR
ncbi:MAG: sulfatase-like hydrolase/transferase [Kiritimatiellae bacterium]|nr:sulfatase-like hydrolase/transferase [Kiritimatiellia bacterium]